MSKKEFINKISKIKSGATFVTIKGYNNAANELANYSIIFNINYKNALKRSILKLEKYVAASALEEVAKEQLLFSMKNRLITINPFDPDKGYSHVYDDAGNRINGIKTNNKTGDIHLFGLVVHKKVIKNGNYSVSNEKDLTKVKNKLKATLPIGKFRQFKILPEQLEYLSVNKTIIKA